MASSLRRACHLLLGAAGSAPRGATRGTPERRSSWMYPVLAGAFAIMKRGVLSVASPVCGPGSRFHALTLDNLSLRSLPVEPGDGTEEEATRSRQVSGACFSRVRPTPVVNPKVVALSRPALALLGLHLGEEDEKEAAEYFSGNRLLPGAEPAAHCYCGHQFGSFAGQLGDGAAMYLGEVLAPSGERWEIQLKGAGLTPYSRQVIGVGIRCKCETRETAHYRHMNLQI